MAHKFQVTNNTESNITLTDMAGYVIADDAEDLDMLQTFAVIDLANSTDLHDVLDSGDLTAKDENGVMVKQISLAGIKAHLHYMNVSGTVELAGFGSSSSNHHLVFDGDATVDSSNIEENATVFLMLQQDGTGGHTITLPTFTNLDTQPVVTETAGKMDTLIMMEMGGSMHLHSYVRHTDTY